MGQINCHQLLEILSNYIDGEVSKELCSEIERHMEKCENCKIVVDSLRKTIYLYKVVSKSTYVPEDVRQRLYQRLNLEKYLDTKAGE